MASKIRSDETTTAALYHNVNVSNCISVEVPQLPVGHPEHHGEEEQASPPRRNICINICIYISLIFIHILRTPLKH